MKCINIGCEDNVIGRDDFGTYLNNCANMFATETCPKAMLKKLSEQEKIDHCGPDYSTVWLDDRPRSTT
jgi:hypothetical protein